MLTAFIYLYDTLFIHTQKMVSLKVPQLGSQLYNVCSLMLNTVFVFLCVHYRF